jgi:hypothetical protein
MTKRLAHSLSCYLLRCRVAWTKRSEDISKRGRIDGDVGYYGEALPPGHVPETIPEGDEEEGEEEEEEESGSARGEGEAEAEEEDDEESDDNEEENGNRDDEANDKAKGEGDADEESVMANSCDLLWQGIVPRRLFHGFRFQVKPLLSVVTSLIIAFCLCRNVDPPAQLGKFSKPRGSLTIGTWRCVPTTSSHPLTNLRLLFLPHLLT